MTLLPLVLSATDWNLSGPQDGRQPPAGGAPGNCRFCGFRSTGWMEMSSMDGEPATACILCNLCHSLDRPTIDTEATLIWLPEMSQAALIATVRRLHVICHEHGAAPTMDRVPRSGAEILREAWGMQAALLRRAAVAEKRLGTSVIRDLAEALVGLAANRRIRASLLGGVRLMPLGRFFRDGVDVYPNLLATVPRTAGIVA